MAIWILNLDGRTATFDDAKVIFLRQLLDASPSATITIPDDEGNDLEIDPADRERMTLSEM